MKNKNTILWPIKNLHQNTCLNCSNIFDGRKNQKYCSKKCSNQFHAKLHYKNHAAVLKPLKLYRARFSAIITRSRQKGLECDLTYDSLVALLEVGVCAYCKIKTPLQVDRKVPSKGYTVDNVVGACKKCNSFKSNVLTYKEMVKFADYILKTRGKPLGVL